ncbi:MAG: protein kinase [Acidimicrobiales bacterium]
MSTNSRTIAGYADAQLIGRGGFGSVYRANDPQHGREVAIKILSGELGEAERRRFDRERQTMGRLGSHPNIVPVYESGYTPDGEGYIVMELASGGSLRERLASGGRLPWEEATKIMAAVANATQAAHDNGVLHRDIKPDNILIDQFGNPKLSDFGIAAVANNATATTSTTATLAHAAPELLQGQPSTPAIDIYAIGSTLHSLLTGYPPFLRPDDESVTPMITRALTEPPPDLRPYGVPDPVAQVVERALAKEPAERQPTASALAAELTAAIGGTAPMARPTAPPPSVADAAAQTVIEHGFLPPVTPSNHPIAPAPPSSSNETIAAYPPPDGQPSQQFQPQAFAPPVAPAPPHGYAPQGFQQGPPVAPPPSGPYGAAPQHTPGGYASPPPGYGNTPGGYYTTPSGYANTPGPNSERWATQSAPSSSRLWLLIGGGLLAALAGAAIVVYLGTRGDDIPGPDVAAGVSTASSPDGSVTLTIDCPTVIEVGERIMCPITSSGATSGEWNIPGFLSAPESLDVADGSYEVFIEPTNTDNVGDSFTITATVTGSDGVEVTTSREFKVVGPQATIECPTEIALDEAVVCTITTDRGTEGEWTIEEFGSGQLMNVPGQDTINIQPTNRDSVGDTFTITVTLRDADGTEGTTTHDFTVTSG